MFSYCTCVARLAGCSVDNRKQIMANVMVTGGNTLFEGLPQMLYKKLKQVSTDLSYKRSGVLGDSVYSVQSTDANGHMCAVRYALPWQIGKARASTLKIAASKDRQISAWVGGTLCRHFIGD